MSIQWDEHALIVDETRRQEWRKDKAGGKKKGWLWRKMQVSLQKLKSALKRDENVDVVNKEGDE